LSARRGYLTLFAGVRFSVEAGEALVVTGPNGSGKTTLLRIVAGLTAPAEGEIRWRDEAMRPLDARMRTCVAFNGHLPALKDELSAFENLAFWIELHDRRASPARIAGALDAVALGSRRSLPVRALSQGQRRRIALARLALAERPVWVLDEPLTALDSDAIRILGDLADAHLAKGGIVIAASHQPLPIASGRMQTLALLPAR
jgi:heme exporter protein A